jgi:hypothetical protein
VEDRFLVVNLVVSREALQQNAFDKLLLKNNVQIEPETRAGGFGGELAERRIAPAPSARLRAQTTDEVKSNQQLENKNADVEWMLVEAPAATIVSCTTELNNDTTNFLSVSVEPRKLSAEKSESELGTDLNRKLDSEWTRFSRSGPQQAEHFTRLKDHDFGYGEAASDGVRPFSDAELGEGVVAESRAASGEAPEPLGGVQQGQAAEEPSRVAGDESGRGLARRLPTQVGGGRDELASGSAERYYQAAPTTQAGTERKALTKLDALNKARSDRVQVLFKLNADDSPQPSQKPKDTPE